MPSSAQDEEGSDAEALGSPRRKKDVHKRVVLTVEQKEKMKEWHQIAETNLKVQQVQEQKYEFRYFWFSVLPTLLLASLCSVLSLASDQFTDFQYWGVTLALLNALNGVIVGVSAFWKWQAKMEKGRFAAQEYDNLKQRLNLWRTKIEYGEMSFLLVLKEVEQTLNDIMKTCGPPDEYLVAKVHQELALKDFVTAKRLQRQRQEEEVSSWWRCLCFCCWRDLHRQWPAFFRNRQRQRQKGAATDRFASIGVKCIEDLMIDLEKGQINSDVSNLLDIFWNMFESAADQKDLQRCEKLLRMVGWDLRTREKEAEEDSQRTSPPTSPTGTSKPPQISKVIIEEMLGGHPNRSTPLHVAVRYQFPALGFYLFKTFPHAASEHCLTDDLDKRMPLEILSQVKIPKGNAGMELRQFSELLRFQTFRRYCIECSINSTSVTSDQKIESACRSLEEEIEKIRKESALQLFERIKETLHSFGRINEKLHPFERISEKLHPFDKIMCENKHNLIHVLAHFGQTEFLKKILDPLTLNRQVKVMLLCSVSNENGPAKYPLGCAIRRGQLKTFKYLLDFSLSLLEHFSSSKEFYGSESEEVLEKMCEMLRDMIRESVKALINNRFITWDSKPRKQHEKASTAEGETFGRQRSEGNSGFECCFRTLERLEAPSGCASDWCTCSYQTMHERKGETSVSVLPVSLLQLVCGHFPDLYLDEGLIHLLVPAGVYTCYQKEEQPGTSGQDQKRRPEESMSDCKSSPVANLLHEALRSSDQRTSKSVSSRFYSLVRSSLEHNFKEPIEDLVIFLWGNVVNAKDDEHSQINDWVEWSQEQLKKSHNPQPEEWSTQTNPQRGSQVQDPHKAKAALLKCLEYVPKKHMTKTGSVQNPTLLHVAARAAMKFKEQIYVNLVAILSVLVNFNKTLYHSMDDDTSFVTPLAYALQPLSMQIGDGGSSCTDEMAGNGTAEQKIITRLLLFDDFILRARRHSRRHSPPGESVLRDLHGEMIEFFDAPGMAYELLEDVLSLPHYVCAEDGKIENKNALHVIGQHGLDADFRFIFQCLPSQGRRIIPMFDQTDSKGETLIHYVAHGIATDSHGERKAIPEASEVASFVALEDFHGDLPGNNFPSEHRVPACERLWNEVRDICIGSGEYSTESTESTGGLMPQLLGLLAIDAKEATLLEKFSPIDQIRWVSKEPWDAISRNVAVDRRMVLELFKKEHVSNNRTKIDKLLCRFNSTKIIGNLVYGWCEKTCDGTQLLRTLCIGKNVAMVTNPQNLKTADHSDYGILGCQNEKRWNLCLRPLEIDVSFERKICGLAYELLTSVAKSRRMKVAVSCWSRENSEYIFICNLELDAYPESQAGNMELLPLKNKMFPESTFAVEGRYFHIAFVEWIDDPEDHRQEYHRQECKISVACIVQYTNDFGGASPLRPIETIPRRMLLPWEIHGRRGTESLLYYASKLEHRSCRRLVQISEYKRFGLEGEEKAPFDLMSADSPYYADFFVPHFHMRCEEVVNQINDARKKTLVLDKEMKKCLVEAQVEMISRVCEALEHLETEGFHDLHIRGELETMAKHDFKTFIGTFAGFSGQQLKILSAHFDKHEKPLTLSTWSFIKGQLSEKEKICSELLEKEVEVAEKGTNSEKGLSEKLQEEVEVAEKDLKEIERSVSQGTTAWLHLEGTARALFLVMQRRAKARDVTSVMGMIQAIRSFSNQSSQNSDIVFTQLDKLDTEMTHLFARLQAKPKREVLEHCCNVRDSNRTILHYASLYGLKSTLEKILDEYKTTKDHAHALDTENKSFQGLLCKKLWENYPEYKDDIEKRRQEMVDVIDEKMRERHKKMFKNMTREEGTRYQHAGENLHAAAAAGNLPLLEDILQQVDKPEDRKLFIKKTDEGGVKTSLMVACEELEKEIIHKLSQERSCGSCPSPAGRHAYFYRCSPSSSCLSPTAICQRCFTKRLAGIQLYNATGKRKHWPGAPVTYKKQPEGDEVSGRVAAFDVARRKMKVVPDGSGEAGSSEDAYLDAKELTCVLPNALDGRQPSTVEEVSAFVWREDHTWTQGDVLCFAMDLVLGELKIALNGVWSQAMIFQGLRTDQELRPAFAGANFQHSFGFLPQECLFQPPSSGASYMSLDSPTEPPQSLDALLGQEGSEVPCWWLTSGRLDSYYVELLRKTGKPLCLTVEGTKVNLQLKKEGFSRQRWRIKRVSMGEDGRGCYTLQSLSEELQGVWLLTGQMELRREEEGKEEDMGIACKWKIHPFPEWHPLQLDDGTQRSPLPAAWLGSGSKKDRRKAENLLRGVPEEPFTGYLPRPQEKQGKPRTRAKNAKKANSEPGSSKAPKAQASEQLRPPSPPSPPPQQLSPALPDPGPVPWPASLAPLRMSPAAPLT